MTAEATEKRWGVWLGENEGGIEHQWVNAPGLGELPISRTYQDAVLLRDSMRKMFPRSTYEVIEVPLQPQPLVGDAYDSSTHAPECMCENVCLKEKEKVEEKSFIKRTIDSCKCGKVTLNSWMRSITDAGNEGTDYVRHTRGSCLTRTQREAQKAPEAQKRPYLPPRLQERPLPFLIGGELLTSEEELAKLLFLSDPTIRGIAAKVTDYASVDSATFQGALEKAWELGRDVSQEPLNYGLPLPPLAMEGARYDAARARAAAIFSLLSTDPSKK